MCSFDLRVYVVFCLTVEEYLTYLPTSIIFSQEVSLEWTLPGPQFLEGTTRLDFTIVKSVFYLPIYLALPTKKNTKKTFAQECSLFLSHNKNKVKN